MLSLIDSTSEFTAAIKCVTIYTAELFKISDEIRSKFAFGDITMKRLRFDERFIAHCERFVSALNHVIGHLDEIGAVIESAETLGR